MGYCPHTPCLIDHVLRTNRTSHLKTVAGGRFPLKTASVMSENGFKKNARLPVAFLSFLPPSHPHFEERNLQFCLPLTLHSQLLDKNSFCLPNKVTYQHGNVSYKLLFFIFHFFAFSFFFTCMNVRVYKRKRVCVCVRSPPKMGRGRCLNNIRWVGVVQFVAKPPKMSSGCTVVTRRFSSIFLSL